MQSKNNFNIEQATLSNPTKDIFLNKLLKGIAKNGIGIVGTIGVGKSYLMQQKAKENLANGKKVIYIDFLDCDFFNEIKAEKVKIENLASDFEDIILNNQFIYIPIEFLKKTEKRYIIKKIKSAITNIKNNNITFYFGEVFSLLGLKDLIYHLDVFSLFGLKDLIYHLKGKYQHYISTQTINEFEDYTNRKRLNENNDFFNNTRFFNLVDTYIFMRKYSRFNLPKEFSKDEITHFKAKFNSAGVTKVKKINYENSNIEYLENEIKNLNKGEIIISTIF